MNYGSDCYTDYLAMGLNDDGNMWYPSEQDGKKLPLIFVGNTSL